MNPYLTSALNVAKRPGAVGALGAGLGFAHGLLAPDVEYDENGRPRRKSRIGSALSQAAAGGLGGIALGAGIKKFVVPGVNTATNLAAAAGTPAVGATAAPTSAVAAPAAAASAPPPAPAASAPPLAPSGTPVNPSGAPAISGNPSTSTDPYWMAPTNPVPNWLARRKLSSAPTDSERAFQYPRLKIAALSNMGQGVASAAKSVGRGAAAVGRFVTGNASAAQQARATTALGGMLPAGMQPQAGNIMNFGNRLLSRRGMSGLGGAMGFASGMLSPGEEYDPETGTYRKKSRIGAALSRGAAGTLGGFAIGAGLQRHVIQPGIKAMAEPLRPTPAPLTGTAPLPGPN